MPLIWKGCLKVMVSRRERMVNARLLFPQQFYAALVVVHAFTDALPAPSAILFLAGPASSGRITIDSPSAPSSVRSQHTPGFGSSLFSPETLSRTSSNFHTPEAQIGNEQDQFHP